MFFAAVEAFRRSATSDVLVLVGGVCTATPLTIGEAAGALVRAVIPSLTIVATWSSPSLGGGFGGMALKEGFTHAHACTGDTMKIGRLSIVLEVNEEAASRLLSGLGRAPEVDAGDLDVIPYGRRAEGVQVVIVRQRAPGHVRRQNIGEDDT